MSDQTEAAAKPRRSGAIRVFAGIFASRIVGFVRDRAIAHYFGAAAHADVFRTALRGPNVLQNLLHWDTACRSAAAWPWPRGAAERRIECSCY